MFALIAATLFAQVIAAVIVVVLELAQNRRLDPGSLLTSGLLVSLAMILSTPVALGLSALFIWLRRGPPLRAYLALRPFGWQDGLLGLVGLAGVWALGAALNPEMSQWMVDTRNNAGPLVLFYLAIVILAPLTEEVVFRGFAFTGLAHGQSGPWKAIIITSLAWGALHVQYGWRELLTILGLGIVLGWLRARSGSLWLPMLVHLVNNFVSMLALEWALAHGS